ncbi:MAG TPA: rRNA maturation RNase YbeY [Pyrinomonadaceae bacterium]|nr:rRNA maturation RNase YbeY [Pyrinomonadaceae bacterium]
MPAAIEVVNRQRQLALDCDRWRRFVAEALKVLPAEHAGVTVAFVSDRAMRRLNRLWRHRVGTTDVLSFPAEQEEWEQQLEGRSLGEVAISVERASEQAKQHGLSVDNEIAQLLLHGLIHLCGYDHETDSGEMNRLELRLRCKLGLDS